ncbi:MAG: efflux transporter outer membrane subunit [Gemmatimonadaceae bacterium]|nr:efflux transporter outer membrane subunit [Gemmatimonadaceae bacterium]
MTVDRAAPEAVPRPGPSTAAGALTLALWLAACTSAPPFDPAPPVAVTPPVWIAGGDGPPAADTLQAPWWSGLDDPNLGALIAEALAYNQDLAAASARVERAVARTRMAGAGRWPQAGVDGHANRSRRNFPGFPAFPGLSGELPALTTSTFDAAFSASWEADLWGRLRADQAAALAEAQATRFDLAGARLSLESMIVRAYAAAAEARSQARLAEATAANRQRVRERIEDRYALGLRTSLDLRLARAEAAGARGALAERRLQLDAATRRLEVLLGRYPAAELAVAEAPPAVTGLVPAGLPADLVRRRPDLAAAERRLASADQRLASARRALLPGIRLTGGGGRSSEELADLLDGDFSVWSLVANLTMPLFQGGRLRAQAAAAEADREALTAAYAGLALSAFAEVEGALAAEAALAEQEAALVETADQASAAESLADVRYHRGLVGLITLLDARRRAWEAHSRLLTTRRRRVDARVDLHVALGGGFTHPAAGAPTDE